MIAFGWYGGKFSHLDFLVPLLPSDATHFCDVFGGSAAVLLNVDPYPVETYNDLDSELVNFFQTLRNQNGKLIKGHRAYALFSRGIGTRLSTVTATVETGTRSAFLHPCPADTDGPRANQ